MSKKKKKNVVPAYLTLALEDRNKTDEKTNAVVPSEEDAEEARKWSETLQL